MNNYKELKVWQKAVDLTVEIYVITDKFPVKEIYTLVSQMRRCSSSIPSNIAEGAGRNSEKDFNHFLGIALGSSYELETQLIISNRLNYIEDSEFQDFSTKIFEIEKMINGLQKSLGK
jgi:four helix bundle protein